MGWGVNNATFIVQDIFPKYNVVNAETKRVKSSLYQRQSIPNLCTNVFCDHKRSVVLSGKLQTGSAVLS